MLHVSESPGDILILRRPNECPPGLSSTGWLVHYYHEISAEELFGICAGQLGDVELVRDAFRRWLSNNPDKVDTTL